MTGGDWHDSLFKDEKGDSLGDGTWGKPDPNEGKLAPVAWDKLPEAPDPAKRVRARLATPAPGSQKESGLLDIKMLAPSLAAGMRSDEPELARERQPTPAPVDVRPAARLATPAKGSAGSGLIEVQELVRMQEQREIKKESTDSVAEAAMEAMNSASSMSNSSLPGNMHASGARPQQPMPDDLDELDAVPNRGRSMIVAVLGLLTIAVGALGYYVLSQP
jgi:hypothetical protein